MRDLFCEDGCLSDYAIEALVGGYPLDQLERLEIAEHLSFCDICIERYTEALVNQPLLKPEQPVAPAINSRLLDRTRRLFINRYTSVVAAASIAIFCFTPETMTAMKYSLDNSAAFFDSINQSVADINERANHFTGQIANSISQFCNYFISERSSINDEKK